MINVDNNYFNELCKSNQQLRNPLSKERMPLHLMSLAFTSSFRANLPPLFNDSATDLSKNDCFSTQPTDDDSQTVQQDFKSNLIPIDNHFSLKYPSVIAYSANEIKNYFTKNL